MNSSKRHAHIAYRCPECNNVIYGLVGEFALKTSMMRLNCDCGKSALTISPTNDGKIKLSAPCSLCRDNHNYVISPAMFFERDIFLGGCPYANVNVVFVGKKEKVDEAAEENAKMLQALITGMGVEALEDLQPEDVDEDDILPDASVYDLIRFVVKDVEADGKIDCPCHEGPYELRYAPGGIQVFCESCGASYTFNCVSPSAAEEYIGTDEIKLS